ncbi:hypothetical protein BsWGS_16099 [Bradybaena similaris]
MSAINNGCLETVCAVARLTTPTSTSHVSSPLSSQPHKGLLLKRITGAKPGCSYRSMRQRKVRLHTTHSAKRRATVPDLMLACFHRLVFPKITETHSTDESVPPVFSHHVRELAADYYSIVSGRHAVLDFTMTENTRPSSHNEDSLK